VFGPGATKLKCFKKRIIDLWMIDGSYNYRVLDMNQNSIRAAIRPVL